MEFEIPNVYDIHLDGSNNWSIDYTNMWGWGKSWMDYRRNLRGITGCIVGDTCDDKANNWLVPFHPRYKNGYGFNKLDSDMTYELLEYELTRSAFVEGAIDVLSADANKDENIHPIGHERGQKLNSKSPSTQESSSSSSDDGKEIESLSQSPPKAPLTKAIVKVPGRYCNISASYSKYKTELCANYLKDESCKMGDRCEFAHGEQELRPRYVGYNFKTKICNAFRNLGRCSYGTRCTYIH